VRPRTKVIAALALGAVTMLSSRDALAVYQCGDQTDDCQCGMSNPYPCCDNGGNCTWWAWEAACCNWAVGLPGWGNANQWVGNASANPDYQVLSSPVPGSIACRVTGTYGHVAWVTAVNGGTITVTEENCCGTCNYGLRTHDYQASYFDGGFIVRKSACECSGSQTQNEACGNCGTHTRSCGGCNWDGWGGCTGEGACGKGQTEEQVCGDCGKHTRTCSDSCQWGDFGACSGPDPGDACETGQPGVCATGVRKCVDGNAKCQPATPPTPEICDKLDNDCNGKVDDGVCGVLGPPPSPDGSLPPGWDSGTAGRGGSASTPDASPGMFNKTADDGGGCGCRTAGGTTSAPWFWLIALARISLRRRSRERQRAGS
jgi:MYXO-CTERM domain-containing protein